MRRESSAVLSSWGSQIPLADNGAKSDADVTARASPIKAQLLGDEGAAVLGRVLGSFWFIVGLVGAFLAFINASGHRKRETA